MTVPNISQTDQNGENLRILAMKTFSEEKNTAVNDIGKKNKSSEFLKNASFHDLCVEIPRNIKLFGPRTNYRTNRLEAAMHIHLIIDYLMYVMYYLIIVCYYIK